MEARFSVPVQTSPWGLPSPPYNGYRVFPGGKVRPERGVENPLLSSVEVKEKVDV